MIKIATIYTEEEASLMLRQIGMVVENREVVGYDGDIPFNYEQLQVWNPIKLTWVPLETVFREAIQAAIGELHKKQLAILNKEQIFNNT